MTDGSSLLMAGIYGMKAMGAWTNDRGTNMLDGGAPFYGSYECADGRWVSLGSIERPHDFRAYLPCRALGLRIDRA